MIHDAALHRQAPGYAPAIVVLLASLLQSLMFAPEA